MSNQENQVTIAAIGTGSFGAVSSELNFRNR